MIVGLTLLLVFQIIGNVLELMFHLPRPGAVVGMFLLLFCLISIDSLAEYVRPIALVLISYLAVLFVPAGVGIVLHVERIKTEWLAITVSLVTSTALAIITSSLVIKLFNHLAQQKKSTKGVDS